MPPVFGLFVLALGTVFVAVVCLGPLILVALRPSWRSRRTAWLCAGLPLAYALFSGFSCAASNQREAMLSEAVERGDATEVRRLLDAGVTADARTDPSDPYGSPYAIHRAIDARRWDIVSLLINHGATDVYYGDDTLEEQSAAGELEAAGQQNLAMRLRQHGPTHF